MFTNTRDRITKQRLGLCITKIKQKQTRLENMFKMKSMVGSFSRSEKMYSFKRYFIIGLADDIQQNNKQLFHSERK